MSKTLGLILLSCIALSCGKVIDYSNNFSAVAFINASPGTPAVNVFVDTVQQTSTGVAYRSASGYLSVSPGARNIELSAVVDFVKFKYIVAPSVNFDYNTASTYLLYDTLTQTNKTLKVLRLYDTLTPSANGTIKVRFVPLAINASAQDVTFLRTSVTPADSVTFSGRTYVGSNPSAALLSAFTTIPLGSYIIKLKTAGTQTVLTSLTTALTGVNGVTGIYTLYSTGTAQGLPLSIGSFRHYP